MANAKSSRAWFKQHINDPYVKRAQQEGQRSRAGFKLAELQEKYRLVRPGMVVVELGAAPGSWTQLLVRLVGQHGLVVAVDKLAMQSVAQAAILQGDIESEATFKQLQTILDGRVVDWVISDCAPDLIGNATTDALRTLHLAQCVEQLASQLLPAGGGLLLKTFQGAGFSAFLQSIKAKYDKVRVVKPKASRAQSREVYLLACGLRLTDVE